MTRKVHKVMESSALLFYYCITERHGEWKVCLCTSIVYIVFRVNYLSNIGKFKNKIGEMFVFMGEKKGGEGGTRNCKKLRKENPFSRGKKGILLGPLIQMKEEAKE